MTTVHDHNKALLAPLRAALMQGDPGSIRRALMDVFAQDAKIRLCYPYQDVNGPIDLCDRVYETLLASMPDLEKRDFIFMAGPRWGDGKQGNWVGMGGNFIGTLNAPWLGIPAHGKPVFMRYHEYLRIEDDKVVEMEGIWDIPQVMLQAGVWPMAPQLGVEWMCPGPAHGMGIVSTPFDAETADASVRIVWDMLHDLKQGTAETPDRGLAGYWHENCLWFGSTGIGSARGYAGIRDVVLKSFRRGLSDNVRALDESVFFGDQDMVAFTGWPSGTAMHSGDGFLGLAPTGKRFTRRSLDFWRIENGRIRENWVMVDMLDLYRQLGLDVFARMDALTGSQETTEIAA